MSLGDLSESLDELEQLERLRSENTPHRPIITHTIDSDQIPSQKKNGKIVGRIVDYFFKVKAEKVEKFAKNRNFRILS